MSFRNISNFFSSYCTPVQIKIVLLVLNILSWIAFSIITTTGTHQYKNMLSPQDTMLYGFYSILISVVVLIIMIYLYHYISLYLLII